MPAANLLQLSGVLASTHMTQTSSGRLHLTYFVLILFYHFILMFTSTASQGGGQERPSSHVRGQPEPYLNHPKTLRNRENLECRHCEP